MAERADNEPAGPGAGSGPELAASPFRGRAASLLRAAQLAKPRQRRWPVRRVLGDVIRAAAPSLRIGELCRLTDPQGDAFLEAEVIGFTETDAVLAPIGDLRGVSAATEVLPTGAVFQAPVGDALLGRVVDALGRPLDMAEAGPLATPQRAPAEADPPDPMSRPIVSTPFETGVRAVDSLLSLGRGQRIGLFAAAGGGKSTLLSMLVRGAKADRIVVALVGERGREVREFIEMLGPEARQRVTVVVATSDRSAMERMKAAYTATAIAENFRDQGLNVLLLMDSVTRFARALREIGLAAGEPPARRGFPPSVFSRLPKLLERAGPAASGSITAIYTVLVEGDDPNEPIADEVRSIVDGHVILSRKLAAANHYPAIDVLESASRVMRAVTTPEHQAHAARIRGWMSKLVEIDLLVKIGEYRPGADPEADQALAKRAEIDAFLRQSVEDSAPVDETAARLAALAS